ncbi:Uncharacterised protein [Candidatus Tiddalikarchaeum anstoanum]|nr:Uncharacterised protein [Candidatus Tiddalikarchaeum anstoanum]
MMKIFQKTHFWKDNRTFLELESKDPEKEGGFPKEGNLILKIGEQSTVKNAFKLSVDEARALRDNLDMFIKEHDVKYSNLLSEPYEAIVEEKTQAVKNEPMFIFPKETEEEKPAATNDNTTKKQRSEFYF